MNAASRPLGLSQASIHYVCYSKANLAHRIVMCVDFFTFLSAEFVT